MAITYSPTSHTTPQTATLNSSTTIYGDGPGVLMAKLSDGRSNNGTVFLAEGLTVDGFPGTMTPVTVSTVTTVG